MTGMATMPNPTIYRSGAPEIKNKQTPMKTRHEAVPKSGSIRTRKARNPVTTSGGKSPPKKS
jgi:hypothetical protein